MIQHTTFNVDTTFNVARLGLSDSAPVTFDESLRKAGVDCVVDERLEPADWYLLNAPTVGLNYRGSASSDGAPRTALNGKVQP